MQLDRIDIGRVNRYLRAMGLPIAGDLAARAGALQKFYIQAYHDQKISLVQCDICDGYSDERLSECPYCGDQGDVEPSPEESEAEPEAASEAQQTPPQGPPSAAEAPEPAPDETAPSEPQGEPGEVAEPGAEIAPPNLDELVGKIRRCGRLAAGQLYTIGSTLKTIRDLELWKNRRNTDGSQQHAGFYAFVEAEVGFKHAYASRLIRVANAFSLQQIEEYGITRLAVALRLPDDQKRRQFLGKAKATPARGPSLSRLAQQVNTGQADTLHQVTIPIGAQVVPMYRRPRDGEPTNTPTEPAKSIRDKPWLRLDLPGDVVLFVRLTRNTAGDLEAIVEHRVGTDRAPADPA